MILYVNGDSHSAAGEAVNKHCFAKDDQKYYHLGRKPHPDNLEASYGNLLARKLGATLVCDAESASSNTRIFRTTEEYLKHNKPDLVVIGWSTWEREEWFEDGIYYQVTASGTDSVPQSLKQQYKDWVISQTHTEVQRKILEWHDKIYQFHLNLSEQNIPHIFFNTYTNFSIIRNNQVITDVAPICPPEYDWNNSYIDPYSQDMTYYFWLQNSGLETVSKNSYHYGADAHAKWAEFLSEHLTKNNILL